MKLESETNQIGNHENHKSNQLKETWYEAKLSSLMQDMNTT
jgi:hypothetical protein